MNDPMSEPVKELLTKAINEIGPEVDSLKEQTLQLFAEHVAYVVFKCAMRASGGHLNPLYLNDEVREMLGIDILKIKGTE